MSSTSTPNTKPATPGPSPSTPSQQNLSSASKAPIQRRNPSQGSSGAAASSRSGQVTARANQGSRRQHKEQRRPKLVNEDAMESADFRTTGTRRGHTNITHLMNFSLPPRPHNDHHGSRSYRNYARRAPTWGIGSGYHSMDKARYVHANFRFIVHPNGQYEAQAADADEHLDWKWILQILASAVTQCSACPICLSTPVAPRMARCGHIFCLPCLLRFMHSTDSTEPVPEKKARWKKCPICFDSVYLADTKPVRWFQGQESMPPREGDDVVLKLIMREPNSTLALPTEAADLLDNSASIPWYFSAEVMDYAHIMKGTKNYMEDQYDEEIEELQKQEQEDEVMFGESTEWTRKAVSSIRDLKEKLQGIDDPPAEVLRAKPRPPKRQPIVFNKDKSGIPMMYSLSHAANSGNSLAGEVEAETSTVTEKFQTEAEDAMRKDESSGPPAKGSKRPDYHHPQASYYFYQALQHNYLSPLDIRILKSAFGDFRSFPSTVLARVERVSTGHIVDDDLRRRARYLTHLPQGCEVSFLECDWADIVSPEVLANFKTEIDRRKRRNRDKDVREEKERARAEREEEDKRWVAARRKRPSIVDDGFSEMAIPTTDPASSDQTGPASGSPPWPQSRQNGQGFASLASPSTSPATARTVWGTAAVARASPPTAKLLEREPIDDGWLQGWEKDLLQQDSELVSQVQATSLNDSADGGGVGSAASAKKKKGKKKIMLMTTGARRGA